MIGLNALNPAAVSFLLTFRTGPTSKPCLCYELLKALFGVPRDLLLPASLAGGVMDDARQ